MNTTLKTLLTIAAIAALSNSAFAKHDKKPAGVRVSWKDVPVAVQATIQSGAAGGKIAETTKETSKGVTSYKAEVKGTDGQWTKVFVTESGALMKVEPDKARNKRKHKPLFG
ncbi:MAG: hypothetical protein M3N12_07030 [Verrucomicrobiota bacterium]|nr:hypothetical protein [Verrucomicrobiota bacterium]